MDIAEVCRRGRGTAVVIGGSIAGIAAAKMLSETFDRVIVLEKDGPHRRREGRPGAAQGWHLHHLLTAGQIELERIFLASSTTWCARSVQGRHGRAVPYPAGRHLEEARH